MDKSILTQYMDAARLIEHTERQLERLKQEGSSVLTDVVKGSNPYFPYQPVTFRIEGYGPAAYSGNDVKELETMLRRRRAEAAKLRLEVEAWINTLPPRIQLIVQIKFLEGATWEETSRRMGRTSTPDALKMELHRYLDKYDKLSDKNG